MRSNNAKTTVKTKLGTFTKVWSVIFLLCSLAIMGMLVYANILPMKYLYIAIGGIAVITLLIFPILFSRKFKKSRKIVALVLSIILIAVYGMGAYYMSGTLDFFSKITKLNVQTKDYYVVVRSDSKYKDIDEIKGKTVQTYLTKETNYSAAKGQLKDKENVEYQMSEKLSDLSNGLIQKKFDIIFISAAHYDTVCDKRATFADESKILYTVKVEVKTKDISKDVDVTKDSFNIYVSGLDVEGNIDVTSRSDVNMIVTVNPTKHLVLLTSIPRDYCIQLPSKGNAADKLTHTGIYGINETIGAVEKLMGIDINYYVKVNYTTVTKFVDAIDGIDVNSDLTFTTSGMHIIGLDGITFYEGENHLDGARALAFARERHSFSDGDVQRNKNQQKIVEAVIKKASSSKTLLTKYSTILNSIENNIEINMTSSDIKKLVKMQLDEMPSWTIKEQNLTGTSDTTTCYSTGEYMVYVMQPDEKSVVKAVDNIIAIKEGNEIGETTEEKEKDTQASQETTN